MIHQKFRVYLRHCITVFFIFFISVAFSQAKNRQNIELPISSKQLSHYYAQSPSGVYEFYLEPKYQEKTTPFNAQESSVAIKGHHFSYNHVSPDIGYAELGGFQLNEHTYKLIAYNRSDDADIVIFNIQLNSYDSNGQLIDALLLDSRFGFEDIQKFSEFKIVQDIVTIDYYVTQVIDVVNDGELGAIIESPIPQLEMQEQYKIDQNGFKLISQTKIGAVL